VGGVEGGGAAGDATGAADFFLPVRVLSRVFRGKFIDGLKRMRGKGKLIGAEDDRAFERLLDASVKHDWVVHAKPPFGGPAQVLKYLARYTHRIAISNRRLVSVDDRTVSFNWKDYAHHNRPRTMTLDGHEFLRRFLLHAVPRGFMRIRHFGLWANRVRAKNLATCRGLLTVEHEASAPAAVAFIAVGEPPPCCPVCGRGRLIAGPHLSPMELGRVASRLDSS
jgi:hypothetical protein